MSKVIVFNLLVAILLFGSSCTGNEEKEQMLEGKWNSYSIARGGDAVKQQAVFRFESGEYSYDIGSHHEEGNYWVEGDKLYTEGPTVMKKKVQIAQLTPDTLVLNMNDKGVPMKMAFVKEEGSSPDTTGQ